MDWQRLLIRTVAVSSCLVALLGFGLTFLAYQEVNRAEAAGRAEINEISDTVDQIGTSLQTVSDSAIHASGTVNEAQLALDAAAGATRSAAASLHQIAQTIPFGLGAGFSEQGRQFEVVAAQLDQTSSSLDKNAADLRAIGHDVARSSSDVTRVARQLRRFAGADPGGSGLAQLVQTIRLVMIGLPVLLVLLFGIGVSLYLLTTERWTRTQAARRRADRPLAADSDEAA